MSTETIDESKCKSALVPTQGVVESSCSVENTIKPSDEFVQVFKITYTLARNKSDIKQIKTIEIKVKKLFHKVNNSQDTKFDDIITFAYICEHISYAYIMLNQEEKLPAAKDYILRCLHLIKNTGLDPKTIMLTLRAYSQLGLIYHQQQKLENAIEIFNKAIDLYVIYMEEHSQDEVPIDYEDIIMELSVPSANNYMKLGCLYSFILRASIDVHAQMGLKPNENFMRSYHLLLIEEFNCLQTTKLYKQWFEKARTVCDYLITGNRFPEANNYINTIMFVKKAYLYAEYIDSREKGLPSEELYEQCLATFQLITLCLARYGVAFFRQSVERLLRLEKDEDPKAKNSTTKYPSKSKDRRLFLFALNKKAHYDSSTYYNIIPFTHILNYNKAQRFFYSILSTTCKLQPYLTFADAKFPIPFILYISNMYKYVAFYEKHTTSRFLLRKRCAEILEIGANNLGDRNDCKLLRLLWLQLTIAYSTLIDMRVEDLEAAPLSYLPQRHYTLVDEINVLVENGLIFLQNYMYYK